MFKTQCSPYKPVPSTRRLRRNSKRCQGSPNALVSWKYSDKRSGSWIMASHDKGTANSLSILLPCSCNSNRNQESEMLVGIPLGVTKNIRTAGLEILNIKLRYGSDETIKDSTFRIDLSHWSSVEVARCALILGGQRLCEHYQDHQEGY